MEESIWFNIENKVRKLVKDIVEPTIRRVQEIKDQNEKIIKIDDLNSEKLNKLEIQLDQSNKRIEYLSSFSNKVIEIESNTRLIDQRVIGTLEKYGQKLDIANLDFINLLEKFSVLDKQRINIQTTLANVEQSLYTVKNNIDYNVEDIKQSVYKRLESLDFSMQSSESKIKQIFKNLENLSSDLSETDYKSKYCEKTISEQAELLAQLTKSVADNKKSVMENIEKVRASMFSHYKEQMDANKRLFRYLDNDYKVAINMGLMEHLYSVVDQKSVAKLAQYEKEKLQEWGGQSLQGTLKEAIDKSKLRCQDIIESAATVHEELKRKASIISLKESASKEKVVSESTMKTKEIKDEVDSQESFNEELELKSNNDARPFSRENDTRSISRDNEPRPNSRDNEVRPVSREKPFLSSSMFNDPLFMQPVYQEIEQIDYMPYIQEVKQMISDLRTELMAEASSLNKLILVARADFDKKILDSKNKQEDFMSKYAKKEKEMDMLVQEANYQCGVVVNMRKRDLSDLNSSISEVAVKINSFIDQTSRFEEDLSDIGKKTNTLLEITKIGLCLQHQDELDKESIALMGYKETKLPGKTGIKKNVVSFDKNCQSCTGQNNFVLSAFKMACLAYTPSPVVYSKQQFARKELIDIQKRMADGASTFGILNTIVRAVEEKGREVETEKKKIRARTALGSRKLRPSSVPISASLAANIEICSSVASEMPLIRKNMQN